MSSLKKYKISFSLLSHLKRKLFAVCGWVVCQRVISTHTYSLRKIRGLFSSKYFYPLDRFILNPEIELKWCKWQMPYAGKRSEIGAFNVFHNVSFSLEHFFFQLTLSFFPHQFHRVRKDIICLNYWRLKCIKWQIYKKKSDQLVMTKSFKLPKT